MVFARKRFGQHFLHDAQVIDRIVAAIGARPGASMVEIGPGHGAITEGLLAAAGTMDAIEIDRDLAAGLRTRLVPHGLVLHEADALRFDFAALAALRGQRLRIVGNLPYNISTPLMFHLLETPEAIHDLHIMLQKEVIDRICAAPGSDDYGRLTVMLAPWVQAEHLFDVGPDAFRPAPRVWSAVARLAVREVPAFAVDDRYRRVVAAAFSQRRKMLRGVLGAWTALIPWQALQIEPTWRAEQVSVLKFIELTDVLHAAGVRA